jgi:hypothetical protein
VRQSARTAATATAANALVATTSADAGSSFAVETSTTRVVDDVSALVPLMAVVLVSALSDDEAVVDSLVVESPVVESLFEAIDVVESLVVLVVELVVVEFDGACVVVTFVVVLVGGDGVVEIVIEMGVVALVTGRV